MQRFCLSGSHILTIAPPLLRLKGYKIVSGLMSARGGGREGGGGVSWGNSMGGRACMHASWPRKHVGGNRDRRSVPQGNSLIWRCAPDGHLMGSLPGD